MIRLQELKEMSQGDGSEDLLGCLGTTVTYISNTAKGSKTNRDE